ncbi:winged helix-turn-helix transcriptional regulator [Fusibacter bizertensis]
MQTLEDLFGKCPYATAQKILSGKWTLMIIHALVSEPLRFNELQRQLPDMTQTTLTRQLRALEDYGIVNRTVYAQIPPKVEYKLTDIGMDFKQVLMSLEHWGDKYIDYHNQRAPL